MKIHILNSSGIYVVFLVLENIEEKMLLGELNKKLNFSSMLICSLSHELQTPMHHLLSSAESLSNYFQSALCSPSNKTTKARADSSLVQKSCLGLSIFIQNLLDFARHLNGCLKATPEEFEVEPLLREAMQIFSLKTAKKNLKTIIECQKGLKLYTDRGKFLGIIYTFLENSVKFTMRGEIKLRVVSCHLPRYVRVEVIDTGIGISPDGISNLLKIIADPFEDVTLRGAAGIGLGIRIAQILLVCITGGDTEVQIISEKGSGTTIKFELLRRMRAENAPPPISNQMKRSTTKIEEVVPYEAVEVKEENTKDCMSENNEEGNKNKKHEPVAKTHTLGDKSVIQYTESLASEDDAVEENMSISGDEDRVRQLPAFREDETEADIPKSALEEKIYDQPPPTLAAGFIGQIQTRLVKKKMYTGKVRLRNSTTHSSQGMLKQAQSIASSSKGKRSSIRGSNRDVNIKLTRNYDKQQSTHISNFLGSELDTGKYNTHTMADMLQPRRNRESIMIEPADDDYDAARRKVALVVDDEVINADILQGWLEQLGLEVFVAYEGELAVELCNRLLTLGKPVDVIFLDYSMPLMNGDECTKALRSSQFDPILKETKIVGLTAHRDPDIREKCLEAGMDVVEYKPILMDKVRSILTRLEIIEE